MEFAYSLLETKEFETNADKVTIQGIASTPTPDRVQDIVQPMGAKFQTPMPLIWMHDKSKPVGQVTFARPTKKGIPFVAEIPKITESGTLKDRIDEALHSLKYNLVNAVSIGFSPLDMEYLDNGGIEFKEWEWLELSLVTVPANPDAKIEMIKSIDKGRLAALRNNGSNRPQTRRHGKKPIQLIPRRRS